jgi:hypothetical protein
MSTTDKGTQIVIGQHCRPDHRSDHHGLGLNNSPERVVPQTAESNIPVYTESNIPCVIAIEYKSHVRR